MNTLREVLEEHVREGTVPGVVGLVARGRRVDVPAAGSAGTGDGTPMARDSIFRIASLIVPADGTVAITVSQVELSGPTPPRTMREFWRYAASV